MKLLQLHTGDDLTQEIIATNAMRVITSHNDVEALEDLVTTGRCTKYRCQTTDSEETKTCIFFDRTQLHGICHRSKAKTLLKIYKLKEILSS